ncbi:hypothetical protein [Streptomyces poonensis]|uniref:Uncharacterized protein n=1 Tax=Streptomyces poonensis TaxID=68255 RepID=A0A918P6W0_9ACTN|nr:hypothetical protein [Streptomyces poonensis]GGY88730.1 hypothetical protein GCM10010365_03500 [Streptomyces poonensis]GLJ92408.1 hypothetical protein GCM10017589_50170 [Streptomyces poonensis]
MSSGESSGGRTPDGADGADGADGGSSIPDTEWEKFLQDSERDIRSSAPKEPSARARMVTERLRQLDAEAERRQGNGRLFGRGRKRGQAPVGGGAWQPDGWRAAPTGQSQGRNGRSARRRRQVWSVVGILVAVALAVFAVSPDWALSKLSGGAEGGSGGSGGVRSTPSVEAEGSASLAEPFRGSPAADYADGADGIVLPPAKAVGALSEGQVAAALRATKQFLVGTNLEPAVLLGERPEGAIGLIDPRQQQELLSRIDTSLRAPDEEHDPLQFVSRFDPDEVRLVGDVIKTRGEITFGEGEKESVEVRADYTFVYPLVRAESGATQVARTIVRRSLVVRVLDPDAYAVTPGRLALLENNVSLNNTDCLAHDGFLHPHFDGELSGDGSSVGPTTDPYDRSRPLSPTDSDACGTATRT